MKHIHLLITVLLLIPLTLPIPATCQQVSLSDSAVFRDQHIQIPLQYAGFDSVEVTAWSVSLQYDSTVFDSVTALLNGSEIPNYTGGFGAPVSNPDQHPFWLYARHTEPGYTSISATADYDTLAASGILCDLQLHIATDAPPGSTQISFTQYRFYPADYLTSQTVIPMTAKNATLTVVIAGDVNFDGTITLQDVHLILVHTVYLEQWLTMHKRAGDMDGNNVIEAYDAEMLLLQIPYLFK